MWEPVDTYLAAIALDAPALRVYMCLWALGERRGDVVVYGASQRQIADALKCGDKTIDRALAQLETQNAVQELERRPGFPRVLQINPPRRLRSAQELDRLPPFAGRAASTLAQEGPRIHDLSNLTLPPRLTVPPSTTLPPIQAATSDGTAKNDAPYVEEGTRTRTPARTAPAPTHPTQSLSSSSSHALAAVAVASAPTPKTEQQQQPAKRVGRTEQEQARYDALVIAGVTDPALSELARLDLTPEQIRAKAENVRQRGKGVAIAIIELRALFEKKKKLAEKAARTAQKPVEERRGAVPLVTDNADADFAAAMGRKAFTVFQNLQLGKDGKCDTSRAIMAALVNEPESLARMICNRHGVSVPHYTNYATWKATDEQRAALAADPRISGTIQAILDIHRSQTHGTHAP